MIINFPSLTVCPTSTCCHRYLLYSDLNQETISSFQPKGAFRRAWSDSNLERLIHTSCEKEDFHIHNISSTPKKFSFRHPKTMLRPAPSFSIFNTTDVLEDEENNGGHIGTEEEGKALTRTVTIGELIEAAGSGEFSFRNKNMGLIEEEGDEEQADGLNGSESLSIGKEKEPVSPPLCLAAGLGINGKDFGGDGDGGGGGGVYLTLPNIDRNGEIEEYYKRMVDEYPCHPLFLANYAQLLQSKGDLHGAEDYYYRATLADPDDGAIWMKYAKLDWELHHDQDRALINFEHAIQAAPQDSHVIAAYASFLWEIDDIGEEDASQQGHIPAGEEESLTKLDNSAANEDFKPLQIPTGLSLDLGDHAAYVADKAGNVEHYYRRMVEENPCNSLVLRNYAHFLYQGFSPRSLLATLYAFHIMPPQTSVGENNGTSKAVGLVYCSKGDLQGAEEYYSRAILADPADGEIMSQYAKLVWELHHDHDKAVCYFERAVQATPEDSNVLAAYASFLWETEENEEDRTGRGQFQMSINHEITATAANT